MTNIEIIAANQFVLYKEGKLRMVNNIIEPIHTFQKWKSLGFVVRKGEKALAKFPVWKMTVKKIKEEETEEEKEKDHHKMIMKTSAFFSLSQVEKIENKKGE